MIALRVLNRKCGCNCIFKAPQNDDARTACEDSSTGGRIEGTAVPIVGKDFSFAIDVPQPMREFDGHAAGKRHVAFVVGKTLACQMNSDQRCRARRLYIDARSAQIKLV